MNWCAYVERGIAGHSILNTAATLLPLEQEWFKVCRFCSSSTLTPNHSQAQKYIIPSFYLFHSQEWSNLNFPCSLTRKITSRSMKNLAFHSSLRGKMIMIPILTTSLTFIGWDNARFELGSERVKEKCMSEVEIIGSIIIFRLNKLRKTKFFILCDVICSWWGCRREILNWSLLGVKGRTSLEPERVSSSGHLIVVVPNLLKLTSCELVTDLASGIHKSRVSSTES